MLVGLAGYPGAGKDTGGDFFAEQGWGKFAFADELRADVALLNPMVGWRNGPVYFNEAIAKYGYTEAKYRYPEIRRALQRFGTEYARHRHGSLYWVKRLDKNVTLTGFENNILTDVRFDEEINYVCNQFGCLIWIDRDGCNPMDHQADNGYARDFCHFVIKNSGTKEELGEKILQCLKEHEDLVKQINKGIETVTYKYAAGYEAAGLSYDAKDCDAQEEATGRVQFAESQEGHLNTLAQ